MSGFQNSFVNAMKAKLKEKQERKKKKYVTIEDIQKEESNKEDNWRKEMQETLKEKKKIEIKSRDKES